MLFFVDLKLLHREDTKKIQAAIQRLKSSVEGSEVELKGVYCSHTKGMIIVLIQAKSFEDYFSWLRLRAPQDVSGEHEVLLEPEEVGIELNH